MMERTSSKDSNINTYYKTNLFYMKFLWYLYIKHEVLLPTK